MKFFSALAKRPFLLIVLLIALVGIFGFSIARSAQLETNLSEIGRAHV